jgi:hypothetical protein
MTPERKLYIRKKLEFEAVRTSIRNQLYGLIMAAEQVGMVITVEQSMLWPPAMANTETVGNVRLERKTYQYLDELRRAAEASEEPK